MEPLTKEDRAELRRLYKPGDIMTRLLDALDAAEGERDNLRSHHHKWLSWQCEAERELDDLRQCLRVSESREAALRGALTLAVQAMDTVEEWTDGEYQDYIKADLPAISTATQRAVAALSTPAPVGPADPVAGCHRTSGGTA